MKVKENKKMRVSRTLIFLTASTLSRGPTTLLIVVVLLLQPYPKSSEIPDFTYRTSKHILFAGYQCMYMFYKTANYGMFEKCCNIACKVLGK